MLVGALQVEVDLLAGAGPACPRPPPPRRRPTRTRRRRCRWSCSSAVPPQSGQVVPGGNSSASGRVNQAFEPSCGEELGHPVDGRGQQVRVLRIGQPVQRKAGMGTPHTRWRDRHQSGRTSIMPRMRSRPQAGIQVVRSISASAARAQAAAGRRPRPGGRTTGWWRGRGPGFLQRQQCGYWWRSDSPGLVEQVAGAGQQLRPPWGWPRTRPGPPSAGPRRCSGPAALTGA